ncbi:O-antigen ligase family protein [Vibrio rotiferianus]|uniref:O-antigen ligase family protein n=1 Tax=Vibrio rotiferianus TaxID=190895 RepID=UPI003908FD15
MIKPNTIVLFLLLAFFTLGMNIYTDTYLGGQGMIQTYNTITAIQITGLISLCFLLISLNKHLYLSSSLGYLLLLMATFLVTSHLNISEPWDVALSTSCVALLAAGSLIVYQLNEEQVKYLLWIIAFGGAIQCVIGISQFYGVGIVTDWTQYQKAIVKNNVPLTIFKQVNVFGSFIATGLSISLLLIINYTNSKLENALIFLLLSFQAYAIYLVKSSRTTILAMGMITILIVVYAFTNKLSKSQTDNRLFSRWTLKLPIVLGLFPFLIAILVSINNDSEEIELQHKVDEIIKEAPNEFLGSTVRARLAIYTVTWDMVERKIWTGYGYGAFSSSYEKHVTKNKLDLPFLSGTRLKHPHNIILYLWVEGGVTPVIILCAFVGFIINQVIKKGRKGYLLLVALTPITLHLLTEAPFTMSIPHILLFGLLLGICTYDERKVSKCKNTQYSVMVVSILSVTVITPSAIIYGLKYKELLTYSVKIPEHKKRYSTVLIEKSIFEGPVTYRFDQLRSEYAYRNAVKSGAPSDYQLYIDSAESLVDFHFGKHLLSRLALSYAMIGDLSTGRKYYNLLVDYYPNKLNWLSLVRYYGEPK